jgi:hypothetical protein
VSRAGDLLDPRVQVVVTPPSDPAAAGHEELQGVGSGDDRPPLQELAERPWLTQGEAVRGAQLETLGLAVYAGHPELSLVNVPTAFIEGGVRLLKELGTYVLAGGVLEVGDVMQMRHNLPQLIGVVAAPGAEGDLLRMILLA